MKRRNLTHAKTLAAKRGSTMNALVREQLEHAVAASGDYEAAAQRILAAAKDGVYSLAGAKWSRENLYH